MREAIRSFFTRTTQAPAADAARAEPLRVAACALLLELAHADDEFTSDERLHIEEALTRQFDIAPESVGELIELAEKARRESTDLFQFTSIINEQYSEGQRMVLAEILWRVVLADGELSRHESYLMRRLANLLELRPGYLSEARRRAGGKEQA